MADKAPQNSERKSVTVLFSGRGSNMATLIAASMAADYPALITNAVTNVPDAGGIQIAANNEIDTTVIDHTEYEDRKAHEEALAKILNQQNPDIIALAGYMRILSAEFVKEFAGRIINIHPSLLPSFKGVDTHHRALTAGVRIHGCSVHFVDETLDGGALIAQAAVPVLSGDDEETLSKRVLEAEHMLYPHALELVASGKVRHSAGRAIFSPNSGIAETPILVSPRANPNESKS